MMFSHSNERVRSGDAQESEAAHQAIQRPRGRLITPLVWMNVLIRSTTGPNLI